MKLPSDHAFDAVMESDRAFFAAYPDATARIRLSFPGEWPSEMDAALTLSFASRLACGLASLCLPKAGRPDMAKISFDPGEARTAGLDFTSIKRRRWRPSLPF